jgi:ABC-type branched-subunit amino acid transport system substrate-binding protein
VRRGAAVLVALVAIAGTLGACGGTRPIAIGSVYPRSGSQGQQGSEEARGVELAAEWVNQHGAVHGRPVRLVPVDVPRAEAASRAMQTLKSKGIDIVVGSHGSAISAAAAQAATSADMLFWETGAVGDLGADVAGGSHFFRLAPQGASLGRSAIAFVADRLGPGLTLGHPLRFAITNVDDAYGHAVGQGAIAELHARGAQLVGEFPYAARGTDYDALADRIGRARPDVLFVAAYLDDGVALRRAMVKHGVHLAASIGTSSSYCHPAFGQQLGRDAVGLFASDKPDAADVRVDALAPEARGLLTWAKERYETRYHAPMGAPALSGFSNAYALFAKVLPGVKAVTTAEVAGHALTVKLPEGSLPNGGGVDLAPPDAPDAGANRAASGVIWEWVAPATRAVVWPPAYATHPVALLPLT